MDCRGIFFEQQVVTAHWPGSWMASFCSDFIMISDWSVLLATDLGNRYGIGKLDGSISLLHRFLSPRNLDICWNMPYHIPWATKHARSPFLGTISLLLLSTGQELVFFSSLLCYGWAMTRKNMENAQKYAILRWDSLDIGFEAVCIVSIVPKGCLMPCIDLPCLRQGHLRFWSTLHLFWAFLLHKAMQRIA